VIYGAGGTDTLDLGVPRSSVAKLDGVDLSAFRSTPNSAPKQVIYHGTSFDFLRLNDGREVYFQGIERLKFSDNTITVLQAAPNSTDPWFQQQWNLA